jgi:hypothetical protein
MGVFKNYTNIRIPFFLPHHSRETKRILYPLIKKCKITKIQNNGQTTSG